MNLSTIWYAVQDLSQWYYETREVPREMRRALKLYMFNIYLQMVDNDLLIQHLNMKNPNEADVADNKEQEDILQWFRKSFDITASAGQNLPSGFVRFISAYTDDDVRIDYVDMDELAERKYNSLTAPSATYPILYIQENMIRYLPASTFNGTMWYYGLNTGSDVPTLALKKENRVTKYDSSNSVELKWPVYLYPQIVMMILKYLGISINDPAMIQNKLNEIANAS